MAGEVFEGIKQWEYERDGKVLPTTRGKSTKSYSYSVLDNIPLVTTVVIDYVEQGQSRGKDAVSLKLGSHPIAAEIGQPGLSDAPISYAYNPVFQSILFQGHNLVDC